MADQGSKLTPAPSEARAESLEGSGFRHSQEGGAARPSQTQLPTAGRVIDGKYRVETLLAQGGMGAVYSAGHVVSGKRVALKWLLPALCESADAAERLLREARATARIDHPNVVDIYDVGYDGDSVYLVMELLVGETLHKRMSRSRVAHSHAVALLMPALRGVSAAHEHGVIHRDLKPDNIFLCQSPQGEPRETKVLDFGISKIANSDHVRDHGLTQTGVVMGTPYYMSPEQVRGDTAHLDERSDVYSLGVILYELLAGQRPFQAETYNQLILKIATEDPAPIAQLNPDVPTELIALVRRAMSRDPRARFANVEELALALEPFAGGATFHLVSSVPGELGSPRASSMAQVGPISRPVSHTSLAAVRRHRLWSGLALGLVLGGGLLWWLRSVQTEVAPHVVAPKPMQAALQSSVLPPSAAVAPAAPLAPVVNEGEAVKTVDAAPKVVNLGTPDTTAVAASSAAASKAKPATGARRASKQAASTSTSPAALPADWDERLPSFNTGAAPASGAASAAGKVNRDDVL